MSALLDGLDPWTVGVSRHAITRYQERRGWAPSPDADREAVEAIRELLSRVAHKRPPLMLTERHHPARKYKVGELVFIVSADYTNVITCYHASARPQSRRQSARRSRR
jgi:hypothetical protein